MNAVRVRSGFTLLEMLVASVLLGMLATLLLALFNQGGIAWTVGEAASVETGRQERSLVRAARKGAETVLVTEPVPAEIRLLSAWEADGSVRTSRPFVRVETDRDEIGRAVRTVTLDPDGGRSAERVEVVVASAGPDGKWGTEDDLTTAPEEDFE